MLINSLSTLGRLLPALAWFIGLALLQPFAFAQSEVLIPLSTDNSGDACKQQTIKRQLPSTGVRFVYHKKFDCRTGLLTAEVINANGRPVDFDNLMEAEAAARQKNPGAKLSPELK